MSIGSKAYKEKEEREARRWSEVVK